MSSHSAWISTAFLPNTHLHDYSGTCPNDIWTNSDGWVNINQPPLSYSVWGPAGVSGVFALSARRTVQQFEMDDDLGDPNLGYGGKAISGQFRDAGAIWPAASSRVNISVYADTPEQVDLQMLIPGNTPVLSVHGAAAPEVPLTATVDVPQEGRHVLQAKLFGQAEGPARLYIKVDYLGPVESTLF